MYLWRDVRDWIVLKKGSDSGVYILNRGKSNAVI